MQCAGRPASLRPKNSHCERGPASSPTRSKVPSSSSKEATIEEGSLETLTSLTRAPSALMTHTLVCSSETSKPAYKIDMGAPASETKPELGGSRRPSPDPDYPI